MKKSEITPTYIIACVAILIAVYIIGICIQKIRLGQAQAEESRMLAKAIEDNKASGNSYEAQLNSLSVQNIRNRPQNNVANDRMGAFGSTGNSRMSGGRRNNQGGGSRQSGFGQMGFGGRGGFNQPGGLDDSAAFGNMGAFGDPAAFGNMGAFGDPAAFGDMGQFGDPAAMDDMGSTGGPAMGNNQPGFDDQGTVDQQGNDEIVY